MTYQEALAKERRWNKRVLIINLFHMRMLLRKKKWSLRKTAKKLNISLGQVSESIRLARAILDRPELELMKRNDAMKEIK
jgi:hypothetical protein